MANKNPEEPQGRFDQTTGTHTVGHEWDGIEELDTPMPRWWLWTFYVTIVWAIGYCILYPAWPMIEKGTEGVLGWTSRSDLAAETRVQEQGRAATVAALADVPIEKLQENPELMRAAIAGGHAAFKVNCVQCHGSGAAGSKGYPNLNDDDWLWGGDIKAIEKTLIHGIRQPGDSATRFSMMPAFGRDGILTDPQVNSVVSHVLSLSGKSPASAAGAQLFEQNCAVCHGADGTGNRAFGAPNLADAIWLFGSSRADVTDTVRNSHAGVMPAWAGRLDPVTIKMLAAYVHSLGGGEDFIEPAPETSVAAPVETPAAGANVQP